MPIEFASFAFIITLAAVVNGLGIVRWLTGLAEFLRRKDSLNVKHYWVYILIAAFQFLMHILMWWSLWSVRGTAEINFLIYVYLLAGPVFLYLGTSVLAPDVGGDVDMRTHYYATRRTYSTVLALLWLWAILMGLVLRGELAATAPVYSLFLATALLQRATSRPGVQSLVVFLNWLLLVIFVGLYAMQLGGAGNLSN
ncbi:MAG: hypothetical protein ACR2QT_10950 [Woeseiaceae bacterium]